MKFISLFLLLAAMAGSWMIFRGDGVVVSERVQMQIQQSLSGEMAQIVADSNSNAYEIEVTDFWFEVKDANNMKAHFKFAYLEKSETGESSVEKSGVAHLVKEKEEQEKQYWAASEVFLEGQKIEFKEGLVFGEPKDESL